MCGVCMDEQQHGEEMDSTAERKMRQREEVELKEHVRRGEVWEGVAPKCYKITDIFTSEGYGGCLLEKRRATILHITGFPVLMYFHPSVKQSRRCLYIEKGFHTFFSISSVITAS